MLLQVKRRPPTLRGGGLTIGGAVSLGDWLGLIGIGIALVQIWRVGRVARATRTAVEEATGRVSLYNFLLVVPELSRLENAIESAALDGDPDNLRRLLKDWRDAVGELHGVLANEGLEGQDIEKLITESLTHVTLAKSNLVSGKSVDLLSSTKRARKSIEQVCIETRRMAASIRSSAASSGVILADPKQPALQPDPKTTSSTSKSTRGDSNG